MFAVCVLIFPTLPIRGAHTVRNRNVHRRFANSTFFAGFPDDGTASSRRLRSSITNKIYKQMVEVQTAKRSRQVTEMDKLFRIMISRKKELQLEATECRQREQKAAQQSANEVVTIYKTQVCA